MDGAVYSAVLLPDGNKIASSNSNETLRFGE